VIEPTPEMGQFTIETRSESFYLRGPMWGYGDGHSKHSSVEIDYDDIQKIRAALDQAEELRKKG
jgi:hypothetical protein